MASGDRRVIWSFQARRQLGEALEYIARDSQQGAQQVLQEALSAAASLATLTERGRVVPEVAHPAIREIFVFRYRLIYEIGEGEVHILAFLHGAREFARWRDGF